MIVSYAIYRYQSAYQGFGNDKTFSTFQLSTLLLPSPITIYTINRLILLFFWYKTSDEGGYRKAKKKNA